MAQTLWAVTLLSSALLVVMVAAGCSGGSKPADTAPNANEAPGESAPVSTPATATRYEVVPAGSYAAYAVDETFLGQTLNAVAVGTTSHFTGYIALENGVIQPSEVRVDLSTIKSDDERRDNQMGRALDTDNHPYAIYKITGAEGNPVLQDGQDAIAITLSGYMTIKGKELPLSFEGLAVVAGDTLRLQVETTFDMNDFGVKPPSIGGFVSVTDNVTLTIRYEGKAKPTT